MRWKSFAIYSRFGAVIMHKDNRRRQPGTRRTDAEADAGLRVVCDGAGGGAVVARRRSVSKLVIGLMQTWDEAAPLPPLQPVDPPAARQAEDDRPRRPSGPAKAPAKKKP